MFVDRPGRQCSNEARASAGLRARLGPVGSAREPTGPPISSAVADQTTSRIRANGQVIQEYRAAYGRLDTCVDTGRLRMLVDAAKQVSGGTATTVSFVVNATRGS